jgi:PadR family transcriptional regulator PadR
MVLIALAQSPELWRHGVSLTKETGLGPGTLYPLLSRLHEQGYLEAKWEPSEHRGRPPRHAYRLTSKGLSLANERQALLGRRIDTNPAGAT